MKLIFDDRRGAEVFGILDPLWEKRQGIFQGAILPQEKYQTNLTGKELANFLFYAAIFMRGGVISEDPFKWLLRIQKEKPEIFDPQEIATNWDEPKLTALLESFSPQVFIPSKEVKGTSPFAYKLGEHVRSWLNNSQFLARDWQGDVRNIFSGVEDFEEAFARVDRKRIRGGILGMRRKIFSLLTIWLQEKSLVPFFPTPIPVDFHALRVLWATEILRPEREMDIESYAGKLERVMDVRGLRFSFFKVNESEVDQVHSWAQRIIRKNGFNHMNVNPALWTLSRELCVNHLQAQGRSNGKVHLMTKEAIEASPWLWPKNYPDPCGICPIEKFCTGVIPNGPYYIQGNLVRLERVPYPHRHIPVPIQTFLPGLGLSNQSPFMNRVRKRTYK